MMEWLTRLFKRKEYPPFFENYLAGNFSTSNQNLHNTRFVVFDTETTGFNYDLDRILCIGALEIVNFEILINSSFEIFLHQKRFTDETVPIHGITKNELLEELTEQEAIEKFIHYIEDAVLVAHHADFDVGMMNQMLERNGFSKLRNEVIDTRKLFQATKIKSPLLQQSNDSLDEIAERFMLNVEDRHTAAGDALLTAMIFLKTASNLRANKGWEVNKMIKASRNSPWPWSV